MKKNVRKLTALFLVLSLMLLTLSACGGSSDDSETTTTSGSDEATTTASQSEEEETTEAGSDEVTKDDILAYFETLKTAMAEGLNTYESSYDDIVAYLIEQGAIAEDAEPVDILTTEGYLTDNTGGEMPYDAFADIAYDYDGVYLVWWDLDGELVDNYMTLLQNGMVVIMGGAALFENVSVTSGCYALGFSADLDEDTVASVTEIFNGIDSTAYSLDYMTSAMDLINALVSAGLVDSSEIANLTDLNSIYSYPTTAVDWVGYDVSESGYGDPYDSTGYCYLASTAYQVGSVTVYYYDTLSGMDSGNLDAVYEELTADGTISPYCKLTWDGDWQAYTYDGETAYDENGEALTITVDSTYGRFAISVEE